MRAWLRDPRARGRLLLAAAGLLAIALLAPFVLGADARHLSGWRDGPEDAADAVDAISGKAGRVAAILATPTLLRDVEDPSSTLYLAIGPERAYDDAEAAAIVDFLRRGGNVILADERGYGDAVANEAGFKFATERVLDTNGHLNDARFPVVDAYAAPGDASPYRVVFNAPSKITPFTTANAHDVLAQTSPAQYPNGSYLDDGDGEIERSDQPGPFPLVVRTTLGQGDLILVADTGLFMNAQARLPSYANRAYVAALVASILPSQGTVLVDESRHASAAAHAPWSEALRALGRATSSGPAPWATLALLGGATVLAWRLTRDTQDWSHHAHDLGQVVPAPLDVRPDLARLQRLARRRISERYNIPLEQVAAMTTEQLQSLTGDRTLAEAASGSLRSDPTPLFSAYAPAQPRSTEVQP